MTNRRRAVSRIFQGILQMIPFANSRRAHIISATARTLGVLCAIILLTGCRIGNSGWYIGPELIPMKSSNFFYYAIFRRDLEAVKTLVESGDVGVNDVIDDIYEQSALHLAVYRRDKDIIDYLLSNGADINMRAIDSDGATPLHAAIGYKYEDIALHLLNLGADPNLTYDGGKTACYAAHKVNRKTSMAALIARLPGCKDAKFDACRKPGSQ